MLTLHVGAGTFLPVKAEETEDHVMHEEIGDPDRGGGRRDQPTRARAGGRIVAVGTTSLRLLETAAGEDGTCGPSPTPTAHLHHARLSLSGPWDDLCC